MICGLRGRTRRPVLLKVRVDELDVLFPHPLDDDTTPILGFPHAEHTMWNLLFQPCLMLSDLFLFLCSQISRRG